MGAYPWTELMFRFMSGPCLVKGTCAFECANPLIRLRHLGVFLLVTGWLNCKLRLVQALPVLLKGKPCVRCKTDRCLACPNYIRTCITVVTQQ